mgnify:CR=1 FL=1
MNTEATRNQLLLVLGAALFLLSGCFNPLTDSENNQVTETEPAQTGSVEVSIGGKLGASTLVPDFAQSVDSYTITLSRSGHADQTATQSVANAGNPVSFSSIAIGDWSVTVDAVDADNGNAVVGSGNATVTVAAATTNSVSVSVAPLTAGNGDLDVSITWPAGENLTVDSLALTASDASDASGSVTQASITDGVNLATTGGGLSSGSYTLSVVLQRDGTDVATIIEAVQIYDNVTTSAAIAVAAGEIGDAPTALSGLAAAEVTGGVELTWTDNSNTELNFEVERSVGGTNYTALAGALPANTTSYTDTGVSPGTTYDYRVRASNGFGASTWSTTSITTLSDEAGLSDLALDGTTVASFDPATLTYTVSRVAGTSSINVAATPSDSNATVSGTGTGLSVSPGDTVIDITVTAENGVTTTTYTITVETPPAAPTGLTASDGTNSTGVLLDWTDVTGADSYEVYRRLEGGSFGSTPIAAPSASTYTDSSGGATSGDVYEYQVVALADGVAGAPGSVDGGFAGNDGTITISFDQPQDPAIVTGVPSSPVSQGTSISVTIDGSYTAATWYLNAATGSTAFTAADETGATIDTSSLGGDNTVSVVVSDGSNLFSGRFSFTVEN